MTTRPKMSRSSEKVEETAPFLHASSEEVESLQRSPFPPRKTVWRTAAATFCAGATIATLIWLLSWATTRSRCKSTPPSSPTITADCGHNASTAIEKGCIFQLWSYSWVPLACYDPELQQDFLALQKEENWGYYSDAAPDIRVPVEDVLTGTRNDLSSTFGQHYWHCAFYQRRFFRLVERFDGDREAAMWMTNRDLEGGHAEHCQEWLLKPDFVEWDTPNINLTVGFHSCL